MSNQNQYQSYQRHSTSHDLIADDLITIDDLGGGMYLGGANYRKTGTLGDSQMINYLNK